MAVVVVVVVVVGVVVEVFVFYAVFDMTAGVVETIVLLLLDFSVLMLVLLFGFSVIPVSSFSIIIPGSSFSVGARSSLVASLFVTPIETVNFSCWL